MVDSVEAQSANDNDSEITFWGLVKSVFRELFSSEGAIERQKYRTEHPELRFMDDN